MVPKFILNRILTFIFYISFSALRQGPSISLISYSPSCSLYDPLVHILAWSDRFSFFRLSYLDGLVRMDIETTKYIMIFVSQDSFWFVLIPFVYRVESNFFAQFSLYVYFHPIRPSFWDNLLHSVIIGFTNFFFSTAVVLQFFWVL